MAFTSSGRLDDKVAIITGAGSGIGAATAHAMSAAGAAVIVADLNGEAAHSVAADITSRGATAVAGVDLLMIEPIPGATLIQADFTHPGVDQQLIDAIGGRPDLVLSDMAHNTVGHRQTDHLKIIALIEIAADFAIRTLKPGGNFVSKNFQGGDAGGVLARLREEFETVKYVKPDSSRKGSAEVFLVALNKR